jgi:hypothetical protein
MIFIELAKGINEARSGIPNIDKFLQAIKFTECEKRFDSNLRKID